jgi:hypothetical protein
VTWPVVATSSFWVIRLVIIGAILSRVQSSLDSAAVMVTVSNCTLEIVILMIRRSDRIDWEG